MRGEEPRWTSVAEGLRRHLDIPVVLGVIGILVCIIVQLPTQLLDFLLVTNITLAIVILLTTMYVTDPLAFAVFPSLLLMTTFYRLALNIATTRLILGRSDLTTGTGAAGRVVEAFGMFVAGNNAVVGLVVFAIIVVVQFVVITRGASRISEVAARFTLDAMPGKQLSIDADLNAGLINEETARKRRESINREADFYGAMDGASRFVRGDAIAGIIITLVNIIGGLVIGITMRGMTLQQASDVFTKLTIGDGLVTQVPALVISVAAGLIITRSTARQDLGRELVTQIFTNPKALYITGAFLVVILPSGLPKTALLAGAGFCGLVGYALHSTREQQRLRQQAEAQRPQARPEPERAKDLLPIDPMELELGYGLIGLVDGKSAGNLLTRIQMIREQIAVELGLVIPPIRIRDNLGFQPNEYALKLRGVVVARSSLKPGYLLAMDSGAVTERIEGLETREPAFGMPAVWIPETHKARAEALGYTVVDNSTVVATHLTEVIRSHAEEILTREEVSSLIEKLKERSPAVVEEVIPGMLKLGDVQRILGNLLRERASIRDLETILEALGDWAPRTKDPEVLTEYVRASLARTLSSQYQGTDGKLRVVTLDPGLEEMIQGATERTDRGSYLTLKPELVGDLVGRVARKLEAIVADGHPPVVLASPQIRLTLRRILENRIPGVAVLSYNEIVKEVVTESVGTVSLAGES